MVAQQFARFGSKCRVFAPSYRQVTLAGLRQLMASGPAASAWERASRTTMCGMRGILPAARQSGTGRGAHRPLAGVVHSHRADQEGNRRQADSETHRVGDPAGRHRRSADGQGRRRNVSADAALPRGVANWMRDHLRIVSATVPPPENALFGRTTTPGMSRRLHEPREPQGWPARAAALVSLRGWQDLTGTDAEQAVGHARTPITTPWVSTPGC